MKAVRKTSKTTKGWGKLSPKTVSERRALLARCGVKAFLSPSKLKFPVMGKTGPCVVDCEGLRSALARAAQFKHPSAEKKARKMGKLAKCRWAVG